VKRAAVLLWLALSACADFDGLEADAVCRKTACDGGCSTADAGACP
jgi:hypothetical protein